MRGCGITHAVGEPATSVTPTPPALLPRGGGGGSSSSATADRMFRLGLTESQSLQVRVDSYLVGGGGVIAIEDTGTLVFGVREWAFSDKGF